MYIAYFVSHYWNSTDPAEVASGRATKVSLESARVLMGLGWERPTSSFWMVPGTVDPSE